MEKITYISNFTISIIIFIIIFWGIKEKKSTFDLFIDGAKEGIDTTIKLIPTLIGIFFAIGMLRGSGIFDFISKIISPITSIFCIPSEIVPLALIRPISGSGAIGVATDIMKEHGVDSAIGNIASVIMGSTETTLYTIAVYTSCIKAKKTRGLLFAALVADIVGILSAVVFCRFLS